MISLLTRQLSKIVEKLNTVKVISTGFNEETANKPVMKSQVYVNYVASSWESTGLRTYEFTLTVVVKDLRTNQHAEDLVDTIAYEVNSSNLFRVTGDNFNGFSEGLFTYEIRVESNLPYTEDLTELENCLSDDTASKDYVGLEVTLYNTKEDKDGSLVWQHS